jgi:hypothetical protein
MQMRHVFWRFPCSSLGAFSPFFALLGVLVALSAQAQQPYITATGDVNVGKRPPGTAYTATFNVQAMWEPIFVDVYAVQSPSNSVTSISPKSVRIEAWQTVLVVVNGVTPSTTGTFVEAIVFKPSDITIGSVTSRIYGESASPPPACPVVPTNPDVRRFDDSSVLLSWDPVPGATGPYVVRLKEFDWATSTWGPDISWYENASSSVVPVKTKTHYRFTVSAYCNGGQGPFTEVIQFYTWE